jgi:hypothetical protein
MSDLFIKDTTPPSNLSFQLGSQEMLKIAEDGFYVRGERVPADSKESAAVYRAFKHWLVMCELTRP